MNQEEREILIWEYIDGACDEKTRGYVADMIVRDTEWNETYNKLMSLNAAIVRNVPEDEPSMRFTKNITEALQNARIAKPARKYINISVIRLITAILLLPSIPVIGFIILNLVNTPAKESASSWAVATDLLNNHKITTLAMWLCIPLLLLFFDLLLTNRRRAASGNTEPQKG